MNGHSVQVYGMVISAMCFLWNTRWFYITQAFSQFHIKILLGLMRYRTKYMVAMHKAHLHYFLILGMQEKLYNSKRYMRLIKNISHNTKNGFLTLFKERKSFTNIASIYFNQLSNNLIMFLNTLNRYLLSILLFY